MKEKSTFRLEIEATIKCLENKISDLGHMLDDAEIGEYGPIDDNLKALIKTVEFLQNELDGLL